MQKEKCQRLLFSQTQFPYLVLRSDSNTDTKYQYSDGKYPYLTEIGLETLVPRQMSVCPSFSS